jgi:hypothetical protein
MVIISTNREHRMVQDCNILKIQIVIRRCESRFQLGGEDKGETGETRTEHGWNPNAEVDEVHKVALPGED